MAAQVDPEITPERFWDLALRAGRTIGIRYEDRQVSLGPILDPSALIEALRS